MTLLEWPFNTEHPDQGCRLFFEEALPLIASQDFEAALPLMVSALRILTRCGAVAGSDHPRQHVVYLELIGLLRKTGHSAESAEEFASHVVAEAKGSVRE